LNPWKTVKCKPIRCKKLLDAKTGKNNPQNLDRLSEGLVTNAFAVKSTKLSAIKSLKALVKMSGCKRFNHAQFPRARQDVKQH
jgi:hypothetical protein